jgi:hypothetical protein
VKPKVTRLAIALQININEIGDRAEVMRLGHQVKVIEATEIYVK